MSFPAPTTGIGVAAKLNVAGNTNSPSGKQFVPGYNKVVLSLSGANGPTTFQLNPEVVDVHNTSVTPGTSYALTAVAASSGPGQLAVSAVAASSGNQAAYTVASGGTTNEWVGFSFIVAGFSNAQNNGTFICIASSSTTLTLRNSNAVAETVSATATSDEGAAVYTGTIVEVANSLVGKTFVVAGFTDANNNGTFIATANNGTTTITLQNANTTAQSGQTATAKEQETSWSDAVASVASSTGVYTGTFPEFAQFPIGGKVTITGFVTNAVNNGTFTIVSATSTLLTTNNTASIAETASATAVIDPTSTLTYFVDGTKNYNPTVATGPVPSGDTTVAVATVSANGLITASAQGGTVVEVSYPVFNNISGATGALSPNPMHGLPLGKIYADITVEVKA